MLPVEVVKSYQEIVWHLLDEIQRLTMENITLRRQAELLAQEVNKQPVGKDGNAK